jgi:hypothetical protein
MKRHIAVAALLLVPLVVRAQLPVRVTGRGPGSIEMATGEPVSFFLEHSHELELTDDQRKRMMDIRRRLRQTNAPWVRQLDSLREFVGLSLEPEQGRTPRGPALERFQKLSAPVADSMRVNNDAARNEVWAILSELQRTKADSVAKADKAPRRTERRERERGAGSGEQKADAPRTPRIR